MADCTSGITYVQFVPGRIFRFAFMSMKFREPLTAASRLMYAFP